METTIKTSVKFARPQDEKSFLFDLMLCYWQWMNSFYKVHHSPLVFLFLNRITSIAHPVKRQRQLGTMLTHHWSRWTSFAFLWQHITLVSPRMDFPEFRCPSPCDTRKFPHYDSCQFYWQCSLDCQHTIQTCVDGKHFSYDTQSCENDTPALEICNKYSFRCSWSLHSSATASCSTDTVIAVSQIDLLSVNKTRCPDTVPDKCCAIPLRTCNVTSHHEQTERARTACDGRPTCSVTVDEVELASGCVADGYYLRYRCLYIPDEGTYSVIKLILTWILCLLLVVIVIITILIYLWVRRQKESSGLSASLVLDQKQLMDVPVYEDIDTTTSNDQRRYDNASGVNGHIDHEDTIVVDNALYGTAADGGFTTKAAKNPVDGQVTSSAYSESIYQNEVMSGLEEDAAPVYEDACDVVKDYQKHK